MSARTDVLLALARSANPATVSEILDTLGLSSKERGGVDTALNNLFHEGQILRISDVRPYQYVLAPGTAAAIAANTGNDDDESADDSAPPAPDSATADAAAVTSDEAANDSAEPARKRGGKGHARKPTSSTPQFSPRFAALTGALAPSPPKDSVRRLARQLQIIARALDDWPGDTAPAELVSMIERCTREAA